MADYASEQTLQDLLQVAQAMNVNLTKISSTLVKTNQSEEKKTSGSSGASSGVVDTLAGQFSKFVPVAKAVGVAFDLLGPAVSLVAKAFSGLFGILGSLASTVGNVLGILKDFALAAATGEMKLSQLADVMGDLASQVPLVGGVLKMLFDIGGMAIKRQEENLEIYRKLTAGGMALNADFETLRDTARLTGLTLSEYQAVMSDPKFGQALATMTGDVESGRLLFNKNMKSFMGEGSEFRKAIYGLGYTTQQAAGIMEVFMMGQGSITKKGLQDSRVVAEGATNLAQEMTFLSEVTGKRREQIEAELKEATEEANWKAFTAGLDPKAAANATTAVADALAKFGPDGAKAVKLAIQTGITTPVNEAGVRMNVASKGQFRQYLENAKNINESADQFQSGIDRGTLAAANGIKQMHDQLGVTNNIMVAQGKGIINGQMQNLANQRSQYKSDAEYLEAMSKLHAKTKDTAGNQAAQMGDLTQNLRDVGNVIDRIMGTLLGPFLKPMLAMSGKFEAVSLTFAHIIEPYVTRFGAAFKAFTDKFENIHSWDEFKTALLQFWDDTKKIFGPAVHELWESTKPILYSAIKELFDFLWQAIKGAVIPRWMRSDTDMEKAEDAAKKKQQQEETLQKINDNIIKLEKEKAALGDGFWDRQKKGILDNQINQQKQWKGRVEKDMGVTPSSQPAANQSSAEAPKVDQATNIRNWAYSMMIGATPDDASKVPASIKDDVLKIYNNPDANLKAQAASFKAAEAKKIADQKAAQEREAADKKAADAKAAAEKKDQKPADAPAASVQEPKQDPITALNTNIARLIAVNTRTAEATEKTATTLASNGNLFRK